MDKSLDEIISSTPTPAPSRKISKPRNSKRRTPARRPQESRVVAISNLSNDITEDDLRDLFRQVGPVVRVRLDRDNQDRRTGKAWVSYDYAADALVASERFNHRRAAGKVITVTRVNSIGQNSKGSLDQRIGNRSRRERGGRKQKPSKPRNSGPRDLDAELDAYMQVEEDPQTSNQQSQPGTTTTQPQSEPVDTMIDV